MMVKNIIRTSGVALALFAALAACDRQPADGAAGGAARSYEIVTQTRPQDLEAYMRLYRGGHGVCAAAREAMHLPPASPLVAVPADFVAERITYLGSGNTSVVRHEQFVVDISEMRPDNGCQTRLASTVTERLVRAGQVYEQRRLLDGHTETDEPTPLTPGSPRAAAFTEKKVVGGIAMRCIPAALDTTLMKDMCAADAGPGVLLDGEAEPVVLRGHATYAERANLVMITEPVTVQIGKPVDQQRIALSGVK